MDSNRLKMNDAKTEFIYFGSPKQLQKCLVSSITVNNTTVNRASVIKYLGIDMDQHLTFKDHVTRKCGTAMRNLQKIRCIRQFLTLETCKTVIQGLVIAHLDYANGLFFGMQEISVKRLQRIQNSAAKLILRKGKYDSSTECLKALHWLPIRLRIQFKIIVMVHKCLIGEAPQYLKDKLKFKASSRALRSSVDTSILEVPFTKRNIFADRAFSVAGPKLWNEVPRDIREMTSTVSFKKALKTFLFTKF